MPTTIKTAFISPIPIADGGTSATTALGARNALGITIGGRTIVGTSDQIIVQDGSGAIGNPIISIAADTILPGAGAVTVPRGANAQLPSSPVTGMMRGNTDTDSVQMYGDGVWFNPNGFAFTDVIYVAKGGDDANDGNRTNAPKLTIQDAIDNIGPDGLVWVLDGGEYIENLTITQSMQLWAPNAKITSSSGDMITVSGGASVIVRLNIGNVNQGGLDFALNIPDTDTVVFVMAGIFFGSIESAGVLVLSDVAQIASDIHILSTGTLAVNIVNAIACTFTFDPGSTIVGAVQSITGPSTSVNTVFGGQTFNDLVQISGAFVVTSLDTTIGFGDLATGGQVPVVTAAGSVATYKLNGIQMNGFGTNFSGGGGDRDLDITDGTSVWTTIPAGSLQGLVNAKWGSVDVPFPTAIPLNTPSLAGVDLYAVYSGGTTDYTAGSLVITLVYERVT